jgi:hypothetical protein
LLAGYPARVSPMPGEGGWIAVADIGIPLEEWNGSVATRELHETIRQFNEASQRQTQDLVRLTKVLALLTAVMLVAVVVQVVVALV